MTPTLTQLRCGEESYDRAMVHELTIGELAYRSRQETACYLRHEPYRECYAFELFRRAIVARDDGAWGAIYAHYGEMVRRWLGVPTEEADECVVEVFERFWQAVDVQKFAGFTSLAAVLGYLKMCALSTRIDRARLSRPWEGTAPLDGAADLCCTSADVAEAVEECVDAARFWRIVRDSVPDERERAVLYLSYVVGLSPRQIVARHGREFTTVADVYRLKRAALGRLRRAPAVKLFAA